MNLWLSQSDDVWRLAGWTMIHFLWVGCLIAAAGGLTRLALRWAWPNVRYALSLVTLLALAVAPVVIAGWLAANGSDVANLQPRALPGGRSPLVPTLPQRNATPAQSPALQATAQVVIDLAHADLQQPSLPATSGKGGVSATRNVKEQPNRSTNPLPDSSPHGGKMLDAAAVHLPWLWIVGAPLTFSLLVAGLIGSGRLRRRCTPVTSGPAFEACQRLRTAMRLTRRVSLAACEQVAQPMLIGIARPLILLPASALSGWTAEELEMVLVHELAHVRRWDNLVNLLQRVIESLLFFHPAVWLVSRQVRRDREECCDAAVVARTQRPREYAELLVSMAAALPRGPAARLAGGPFSVGSTMASHPLAGRIRRILKLQEESMGITRRTLAAMVALPLTVIAATVYTAVAQVENNSPPLTGAIERLEHKPEAIDSTPSELITKVYPAGDIGRVNFRRWMQLIASDEQTRVQWTGKNQSLLVTTTEATHTQIADFLRSVRDETHIEPEASQRFDVPESVDGLLTVERALQQRLPAPASRTADLSLQDLLVEIEKTRKELEAAHRELANIQRIERAYDSNMQDAEAADFVLAAQLKDDRTHQAFQGQATALKGQLDRVLKGKTKVESSVVDRLRDMTADAERQLKEYRRSVEESVRRNMSTPAYARRFFASNIDKLQTEIVALENRLLNATSKLGAFGAQPIDEPQGDTAGAAVKSRRPNESLPASSHPSATLAPLPEGQGHSKTFSRSTSSQQVPDYGRNLAAGGYQVEDSPHRDEGRTMSGALSSPPRPANTTSSRFPSLDEQRTADRAYKLLGLELEPVSDDEHARVKKLGYAGGLRIVDDPSNKLSSFDGDILVGLHVWPITDMKSLDAVLVRDDLDQLNPLKYYIVRNRERTGQFGNVEEVPDHVVTGRLNISDDALMPRELSAAAEQFDQLAKVVAEPRIKPFDVVRVVVAGAFPDQPIDGDYAVEPQGTLALGPRYGRVEVAGMTLAEAEKAIEKHLEEIFTDVDVQVTLPVNSTRRQELTNAVGDVRDNLSQIDPVTGEIDVELPLTEAPPAQLIYHYDGKTFEQWRESWRQELKTERRLEAIEALAAFGRADYAKEAVAAILDVAAEYDPRRHQSGKEQELVERIVERLARLPADQVLPQTLQRLASTKSYEHQRWQAYAAAFVQNLPVEPPARELAAALLEYADREMLSVIASYLVRTDQALEEPLTIDVARQALLSDPPIADPAYLLRFTRLDKLPEQLRVVLHPEVGRAGRDYLQHFTEESPQIAAGVTDGLLAVMADPQRIDQHVAAIRSLRKMTHALSRPELQAEGARAVEALKSLLQSSDVDRSTTVAAAVALMALKGFPLDDGLVHLRQSGVISEENFDRLSMIEERLLKMEAQTP